MIIISCRKLNTVPSKATGQQPLYTASRRQYIIIITCNNITSYIHNCTDSRSTINYFIHLTEKFIGKNADGIGWQWGGGNGELVKCDVTEIGGVGMRIYVEALEDVTPRMTECGCRRGWELANSGKMIFRSRYKLK